MVKDSMSVSQRAKKVFDPSDNNVVKRKRGRPVSQNKIQGSQESQESKKPTAKEGPNRQCSLCAKEKSESLVACRDCTVRGEKKFYLTSIVCHFHQEFH